MICLGLDLLSDLRSCLSHVLYSSLSLSLSLSPLPPPPPSTGLSWLRLQRRLRYLLRRAAKEARARKGKAATQIQSLCRRTLCRTAYICVLREKARQRAVIAGQSIFRGRVERMRFTSFRLAVVSLQSECRRRAAVQTVNHRRLCSRAATTLQCFARTVAARRQLGTLQDRTQADHAATALQCAVRARLARIQRDEMIALRARERVVAATRVQVGGRDRWR